MKNKTVDQRDEITCIRYPSSSSHIFFVYIFPEYSSLQVVQLLILNTVDYGNLLRATVNAN